jgi:hypothetical protein
LNFDPKLKYEFVRSREKVSGKKCASIFLKVGSKESLMITEEKFGSRQAEMLKFQGSN